MAQGEFTKEEGANVNEALKEMFDAIPKSRRMEYIGHLNDISLFISAAIRNAPNEAKKTEV